MAKEFFKDLPNTTTPLNASRLNGLLDGEEPMGNLVVDSIRTKNIFGNYIIMPSWMDGTTWNVHSVGNNRTAIIPCKPNTTYTISRSVLTSKFRVATYSSSSLPVPTTTATDYTVQTVSQNNSGTTITYTTNATAKWLLIHYGHIVDDSSTITESLASIQVETGSTASTFSSFQPLDLQIQQVTNYTRNTTYVPNTGYLGVYNYGKMCLISFNAQLVDNTPSNTTLLSGLPNCYADRFTFSGTLNNGNSIRLYITKDGELKNDGIVYLSGASGWINSFIIYPIK